MPRQRTGTLERAGTWPSGAPKWRFRLRLGDGTKSERFELPEGFDERQARAQVAKFQADEDVHRGILNAKVEKSRGTTGGQPHQAVTAESADEWFERYLPTIECGEGHRRITRHNWTKWIAPSLGSKPMKTLTRDDVEDVRDRLDRAIDEKEIRHGTASNIWSTLTGALKAACAARDRSLRVHSSPLHFGILPPKRGDGRKRPWLYPNEWQAVAACAAIPIEWRQLYAVALYTGLRPNELRALRWADVDTRARQISVSKAWDEQTKTAKPPKTAAGQRTVPIEPALLPLLQALQGDDDEPVMPLLARGEDRNAGVFRAHIEAAGVARARLTADNETEEPADFRTLRDSYATWQALAGVPDKRIQRRLGHATNTTTDRYIKAAEAFDPEAIGMPFPPLPAPLLDQRMAPRGPTKRRSPGISRASIVARVGFEPTTFGL